MGECVARVGLMLPLWLPSESKDQVGSACYPPTAPPADGNLLGAGRAQDILNSGLSISH